MKYERFTFPMEEKAYRPDNYDEICDNDKFHYSEKGCDIEMRIEKRNERLGLFKYCKTHKVLCSKTGWELGWYQGTKSTLECRCLNCGRIIDHATYCKECGTILAGFRAYLHWQLHRIVGRKEFIYYGKLDKIKMNMLDYMKGIYLEKQRKVEKEDEGRYELLIHLIELNIKEKIKRTL